jgi:hypothetical protein
VEAFFLTAGEVGFGTPAREHAERSPPKKTPLGVQVNKMIGDFESASSFHVLLQYSILLFMIYNSIYMLLGKGDY